jgi:iron complex transport system substrate-binding protein
MNPLRIVSLLSSATEMLYAIGLGENVVAVSHECDWPAEVVGKPRATISNIDSSRPSGDIDSQVRSRLAAGEPLYGVDADLIASLRPDLIVTQAQCDVCAVRLDDVRALIASQPELKATRLISLQPSRLDDILADILRLGEATGREVAARNYVAVLQASIERVRERVALELATHGRRRVAIIEWTEPLMLAGNWTPELVEIAGGTCPLTVAGHHSRYHDWSEIRAFDPEVVVVAPCGFDLRRSIEEAQALRQLPDWSATVAAQHKQIFALDGNAYLNRSGPRIVDTVEILAELFWGTSVPAPARQIGLTELVPRGGDS